MSKRIDLLRLDYIFSVTIPMLVAIYLNNLSPFAHLDILVGFSFLAITGNTWNDVIDMRHPEELETLERVEGYHPREILTVGVVALVLGLALLFRTCIQHPINAILLISIITLVLLYCVWFKPVPVLNHILLGGGQILLPYWMIKIDAGLPLMNEAEWILMIALFFFGLTGQLVHEVIDGDSITKYLSLKQIQVLIWIFAVLTILSGIYAFTILNDIYLFPFIIFPLGTMFTFRHPTESTKGVKDVGILIGNFLQVYFLTLITMQMAGVI